MGLFLLFAAILLVGPVLGYFLNMGWIIALTVIPLCMIGRSLWKKYFGWGWNYSPPTTWGGLYILAGISFICMWITVLIKLIWIDK